jgi:hypothetical protein
MTTLGPWGAEIMGTWENLLPWMIAVDDLMHGNQKGSKGVMQIVMQTWKKSPLLELCSADTSEDLGEYVFSDGPFSLHREEITHPHGW